MLGISKRGDTYLRTLLIHGARAVLTRSKAPPAWALRLAERRTANVVTVAIANKTAHTIWALLAHDRVYQAKLRQPAGLGAADDGTTNHYRRWPLKDCARYDKE